MKGKMLKEVQFVDDEHEKFFLDNIVRCRYEEVYHHALIYCLGISETTRRNIDSIYDFATGCIKTECLCEDWQTSGSILRFSCCFPPITPDTINQYFHRNPSSLHCPVNRYHIC